MDNKERYKLITAIRSEAALLNKYKLKAVVENNTRQQAIDHDLTIIHLWLTEMNSAIGAYSEQLNNL